MPACPISATSIGPLSHTFKLPKHNPALVGTEAKGTVNMTNADGSSLVHVKFNTKLAALGSFLNSFGDGPEPLSLLPHLARP